ncbi:MAG: hypothetical protein Q9160_006739 [Pyrenula sp. 1 TL-2023]
MISSLTTTFLSYMRHDLTSASGVPFGAAFSGLQIIQLSYLWSPEFWGALTSGDYGLLSKIRLALATILIALLAATVGPAGATCMIPRNYAWPYQPVHDGPVGYAWRGDLLRVNATEDQMYPVKLTNDLYNNTCDFDTNSRHLNTVDGLSKGVFQLPCSYSQGVGRYALYDLYELVSKRTPGDNVFDIGEHSCGPWPSSGLSLTLCINEDGNSTTFSTQNQEMSAISQVCYTDHAKFFMLILAQTMALNMLSGEMQLKIKNTQDAYTHVQCLGENRITHNISDPAPPLNFSASVEGPNAATDLGEAAYKTITTRTLNQVPSDIFFVDLPDQSSGIVWAWPLSPAQIGLIPCIFELGWFPSSLQWVGSNLSSSEGPSQLDSSKLRKARADQEWLSSVNPYMEEKNMTVFGSIVTAAVGFPGAGDKAYFLPLAQRIMSMLLTAALSNTPPQLFNYGFTDLTTRDFPLVYPLEYFIQGFGYGPNVLAVQISLVILVLYCTVTIAHILYSIWTGNSSSAWDSISELVALAINSRPAEEMQNMCAGINSAKVFGQRVRIAPTGGAFQVASVGYERQDITLMPAATVASSKERMKMPPASTGSLISISRPAFMPMPTVKSQKSSTYTGPALTNPQCQPPTTDHLELIFASSGIPHTATIEMNRAYGALNTHSAAANIKLKVE